MLLYDIEFEYCYQIIFVQSVQRWSNFDWTIVKEDAGLMRFSNINKLQIILRGKHIHLFS
jgi:hypothetical protein